VRVIGDKADSLPKVPGSGTVIGAVDIQRAQPVETSQMLRRVPGIQSREDFGAGGRIDISVRGLEAGRSRRVLLLEDGMPISLNPYSEPDMNHTPPIERYRSIEVVKGSGNILFGPQTLAGTINFVTIAPPDHQQLTLDVDGGNYGYVRGLARYGDAIGDTRYVIQVMDRRGDGYRELPFNSADGLAKIAFPTGRDGAATLKIGFHRDDAGSDDIGLTAPMYHSDPHHASLSPKSQLLLERYDIGLTHEQRFSNAVSLTTLAYAYRTSRLWRRQDYVRTPVAGATYERMEGDPNIPGGAIYFEQTNVVLDRSYDVFGVEPRFKIQQRFGDTRHRFDIGGRVLAETSAYQQRSGDYPETYVGTIEDAEKRNGLGLAGYIQDRIAFTNKLLVTPGVRFEQYSTRRVTLRDFEAGRPVDVYRQANNHLFDVIPGIGMVYGTRQAHAFFGMHRGFAPPRITASVSPNGTPAKVGADESTNYELGGRVTPTKWLRVEATGFLSVFSNQVIVNSASGADTSLSDAGATTLKGVESATTVTFSRALNWPTLVELGARYTFSQSKFRFGPDAGHLLPYAPQHSANANFDVEHQSGIGGQIAYTFVGPQFTDSANTVAEDVTGRLGKIDPWHIVDATAHYRHRPTGLTFRLTVKNLLDTTYISARRPEGIQPGGFRLILLGVRWDWDGKPNQSSD
jgi:Fe(3+) dicitrate transport protein